MNKFFGKIGYAITKDMGDGIWKEEIKELEAYGDILRNITRRSETSESVNDDINISNRFSILADPFAMSNFQTIKYIEFLGVKWKVKDIEVSYPRLIISVGGVYNE